MVIPKPPKPLKAGAGMLLRAGGKLKEGAMAGAGGLKENEVEAAGMLSRLKEAAEAEGKLKEGEVAAAWGLPKWKAFLKELLELSIP